MGLGQPGVTPAQLAALAARVTALEDGGGGGGGDGPQEVFVRETGPSDFSTEWVWYKPSTREVTWNEAEVAAPSFSVAPGITGTALVGSTLTCDGGTVAGSGTIVKTYQWTRGGVDISGATASTHVVVSGDVGSAIRCVVTASGDTSPDATGTSNAITPAVPVNTIAPAITGSAVTGQTLTGTTGTWTSAGSPTYARTWQRDGVDISGATAATYDLQGADEGHVIRERVTATDANGAGTPAVSNTLTPSASATAPGAPTNLVLTAGDAQIGATWTAPASNGGSAITTYLVEYRTPSGSGSYTTFAHSASTTAAITITGLTNGSVYGVRVSAVNAIGTGTATSESTATPTGSLFDPTTIASLKMQLRRSSLTGSDGSTKNPWLDTSGHARNFGNDTGPFSFTDPTVDIDGINGGRALNFDGTQALKFNEYIWSGFADLHGFPSPQTIMILAQWPSLPVSESIVLDGVLAFMQIQLTSASKIKIASDAGSIEGTITNPTAPKVITVIVNGASSKLRVNGTEIATGDLGTPELGGFFMGAEHGGGTKYAVKGGGFLAFGAALSGTDLTNAESVLRTEGGV